MQLDPRVTRELEMTSQRAIEHYAQRSVARIFTGLFSQGCSRSTVVVETQCGRRRNLQAGKAASYGTEKQKSRKAV
ncbi:hypothetical protein [Hyphomicrobium sulfonivorans]|uniref:hypothetical protein n=1 Tax=Hyphomicrobium sulfonivorans TaxID=121290 RepID=UPI0012EE3151|nr:hypothetical protein [Hyphomicrobium sulfonivorans]